MADHTPLTINAVAEESEIILAVIIQTQNRRHSGFDFSFHVNTGSSLSAPMPTVIDL